jgi:8-oxo-dGTP pyrophosphatase MutT (NUDIX family)
MNPGLKPAAVVFAADEHHNVLTITRKTDQTQLGLIGGKREGNETPKRTAAREFREETGSEVAEEDLVPLYQGDDGCGYWCVGFFAKKIKGAPMTMEVGGIAAWVTLERLCDPAGSPFADYNDRAVAAFKGMGQPITKRI